jgi:hypothetical protein
VRDVAIALVVTAFALLLITMALPGIDGLPRVGLAIGGGIVTALLFRVSSGVERRRRP